MREKAPKRVPALYARFSSDVQNPSSVTDQLARLREHLKHAGVNPERALVFSDEAVSGAMWKHRPGVQKLLAAIKRREVSTVYAEDLDRISRDTGDLSAFRKLLRHFDVAFVSIGDGMRLDGSSGSAVTFMVKSLVAEQAVSSIADKSQRGLRVNALERKSTGGKTYGYAGTEIGRGRKGTPIKRVDINPEQADVVRRIFNLYKTGQGYGAIAAALNSEHVPAPRGAHWMGSAIREMLRNPRYVGDWTFGRREWGRHPDTEGRVVRRMRDGSKDRDRERLVEAKFPELAIIDAETWGAVQARLTNHLDRYRRREISDRKSYYLLSGILRCGTCGGLMQIAGGSIPRYRCSTNAKQGKAACANSLSVREKAAREAIIAGIAETLSRPETYESMNQRVANFLRKQAAEKDARQAKARRELGAAEARLAANQGRYEKLLLRWADSGQDDEDLETLIAKTKAAIAADRARIVEARNMETDPKTPRMPAPEEISELTSYITSLQFMNELDQEFDDGLSVEARVGQARETLRTLLADGQIRLLPDPANRTYDVSATLWPLALVGGQKGPKAETPPGSGAAYDNPSCAGTQRGLSYIAEVPLSLRVCA